MRIYWVLGLVLAMAGYFLGSARALPALSAFVGAGIETVFAIAIAILGRHALATNHSFNPKPLRDFG